LVPVPASVFDDDFFRSRGAREASEAAVSAGAQRDGRAGDYEPEMLAAPHEAGGGRLFAGASASHAEHPASDELDIPAFLRRSH
jgi:cell division protein FtsZ